MTIKLSIKECGARLWGERTREETRDPPDHLEHISMVAGTKLTYINPDRRSEHAEPVDPDNSDRLGGSSCLTSNVRSKNENNKFLHFLHCIPFFICQVC